MQRVRCTSVFRNAVWNLSGLPTSAFRNASGVSRRLSTNRGDRSVQLSAGNPSEAPVNISHFKNVFQRPDTVLRKRHKLRWDWHLRNVLISLIPPAVLWILMEIVEWRFDGEGEELRSLSEGVLPGTGNQSSSNTSTTERKEQISSLSFRIEERLAKLEKKLEKLTSEKSNSTEHQASQRSFHESGSSRDVVKQAKLISHKIVRAAKDDD